MLVSWNTTNACNLKCRHCYREAGQEAAGELTFSEGVKLLQGIRQAGFRVIVFSGGEPLLRPDIYELIAEARSLGLRPVCGTNGTLLTRDVVRKLRKAGIAVVGISIDSIVPERHDLFRGFPGSWQAAWQGIENCRSEGLPFQIHTTVFPWNYQEIESITDLAVEVGARAHHVFFFIPTGRGKRYEETLAPETCEDLLVRLLDRQAQVSLEIKPTCAPQFMRIASQRKILIRFTRGCLAGIAYCIIGPQGDVYPCPYLDLKVGNVRELPFQEIWQNNLVFQKLRAQRYEGYCGICRYRRLCGGCRARAFEETKGNYLAEDPLCLYREVQEKKMGALAEELIIRLQQGLPLVPRPFLALAEELRVKEKDVLKALRWLKAKGIIRRLGATFNSQQLGFSSTLCAVRVPPERIAEVASLINTYPGVTHNYLREHDYNLWFTITVETEVEVSAILEEIKRRTGIEEILNLPALNLYKVSVNFPREEIVGVFTSRTGCHSSFAI